MLDTCDVESVQTSRRTIIATNSTVSSISDICEIGHVSHS